MYATMNIMSTQFYTYLWIDPKTNIPRYVGKGCGYRAYHHLKSNSRIGNLLRKRIRDGYSPQPIIHYEVDEDTALEMEKFWINHFGREDLGLGTLFNLTNGGDGTSGKILSEDSRNKISLKLKNNKNGLGTKRTEEVRLKMSIAQKLVDRSNHPAWNKGLTMSEEFCHNISKRMKGCKSYERTTEMNLASSLRQKNRIITIDHRNKLSKATTYASCIFCKKTTTITVIHRDHKKCQ